MKLVFISLLVGIHLIPIAIIACRRIKPFYRASDLSVSEEGYKFSIEISPARWRPIFFETWLTPKYEISVRSSGSTVESGRVECWYASREMSGRWGPISRFGVGGGDVFSDFRAGETKKFTATLDSSLILGAQGFLFDVVIIAEGMRNPPAGQNHYSELGRFDISKHIRVHSLATFVAILSVYGVVLVALLGVIAVL